MLCTYLVFPRKRFQQENFVDLGMNFSHPHVNGQYSLCQTLKPASPCKGEENSYGWPPVVGTSRSSLVNIILHLWLCSPSGRKRGTDRDWKVCTGLQLMCIQRFYSLLRRNTVLTCWKLSTKQTSPSPTSEVRRTNGNSNPHRQSIDWVGLHKNSLEYVGTRWIRETRLARERLNKIKEWYLFNGDYKRHKLYMYIL